MPLTGNRLAGAGITAVVSDESESELDEAQALCDKATLFDEASASRSTLPQVSTS